MRDSVTRGRTSPCQDRQIRPSVFQFPRITRSQFTIISASFFSSAHRWVKLIKTNLLETDDLIIQLIFVRYSSPDISLRYDIPAFRLLTTARRLFTAPSSRACADKPNKQRTNNEPTLFPFPALTHSASEKKNK